MSCPDWRELVAQRDAAPARELAAWVEARRHATHCDRCREEALAADPLLLFARLPERRATPDEIGDMQSAVAALVRTSRVARGSSSLSSPSDPSDPSDYRSEGRGPGDTRRSRRLAFTRVAAALGVCSLLALSGAPRPRSPQTPQTPQIQALAGGEVLAARGASVEEVQPLGSVVEELDRPGARIYELPQSGMAVVMIVDASLDV